MQLLDQPNWRVSFSISKTALSVSLRIVLKTDTAEIFAPVPSILQRYKRLEICLVLKVVGLRNSGVRDFVFHAIPSERQQKLEGALLPKNRKLRIESDRRDDRDQSMLAEITEVVEDVEGVVPSLVRLEAAKDRLDFRREILGPTLDGIVNVGGSASEGKGDLVYGNVAGTEETDCPGSVIETGAEMLNRLCDQNAPLRREPLRETEFVGSVRSIHVVFRGMGIWLFRPKLSDFGIQRVDVFVCACDPELCAKEWIKFRDAHDHPLPECDAEASIFPAPA